MKVTEMEESAIHDIGHAFGYYDYGREHGLADAFPSRDAVAAFIGGYVRMALQSGMLYATSEKGEGYIAYKRPGEKITLKAGLSLARGFFSAMNPGALLRIMSIMSKGGSGLDKQLEKAGQPYIYVGMVCVREQYQGQGYMRKVMDLAFAEGNRLGVPVILDTDAKSKCDKYTHLGMELAGTRRFGECGIFTVAVALAIHTWSATLAWFTTYLGPRIGSEAAIAAVTAYQDDMLLAILPMYLPMVLVIGIYFVMLLAGKTRYPRGMLLFHPVTWNILLVVIPDIAQAMQVPAATWMSVMSQSSTNSSIIIWCIAAAVYEKKCIFKKKGIA